MDMIVQKDVLIEHIAHVLRLVYDKVGKDNKTYKNLVALLQNCQSEAPENIDYAIAKKLLLETKEEFINLPDSIETRAQKKAAAYVVNDPCLKEKCISNPDEFKKIVGHMIERLK